MLAAKAISLATRLSEQKRNVLIGLDGYRHLLQAEWHMMQLMGHSDIRR